MKIPIPLAVHHIHPILEEMKERLEKMEKEVFGEKPPVETKEEGEEIKDESEYQTDE